VRHRSEAEQTLLLLLTLKLLPIPAPCVLCMRSAWLLLLLLMMLLLLLLACLTLVLVLLLRHAPIQVLPHALQPLWPHLPFHQLSHSLCQLLVCVYVFSSVRACLRGTL
jgi:hypothetical protein